TCTYINRLLPYTTLFRSRVVTGEDESASHHLPRVLLDEHPKRRRQLPSTGAELLEHRGFLGGPADDVARQDQHRREEERDSPTPDRKSTRLNSSHVKISY